MDDGPLEGVDNDVLASLSKWLRTITSPDAPPLLPWQLDEVVDALAAVFSDDDYLNKSAAVPIQVVFLMSWLFQASRGGSTNSTLKLMKEAVGPLVGLHELAVFKVAVNFLLDEEGDCCASGDGQRPPSILATLTSASVDTLLRLRRAAMFDPSMLPCFDALNVASLLSRVIVSPLLLLPPLDGGDKAACCVCTHGPLAAYIEDVLTSPLPPQAVASPSVGPPCFEGAAQAMRAVHTVAAFVCAGHCQPPRTTASSHPLLLPPPLPRSVPRAVLLRWLSVSALPLWVAHVRRLPGLYNCRPLVAPSHALRVFSLLPLPTTAGAVSPPLPLGPLAVTTAPALAMQGPEAVAVYLQAPWLHATAVTELLRMYVCEGDAFAGELLSEVSQALARVHTQQRCHTFSLLPLHHYIPGGVMLAPLLSCLTAVPVDDGHSASQAFVGRLSQRLSELLPPCPLSSPLISRDSCACASFRLLCPPAVDAAMLSRPFALAWAALHQFKHTWMPHVLHCATSITPAPAAAEAALDVLAWYLWPCECWKVGPALGEAADAATLIASDCSRPTFVSWLAATARATAPTSSPEAREDCYKRITDTLADSTRFSAWLGAVMLELVLNTPPPPPQPLCLSPSTATQADEGDASNAPLQALLTAMARCFAGVADVRGSTSLCSTLLVAAMRHAAAACSSSPPHNTTHTVWLLRTLQAAVTTFQQQLRLQQHQKKQQHHQRMSALSSSRHTQLSTPGSYLVPCSAEDGEDPWACAMQRVWRAVRPQADMDVVTGMWLTPAHVRALPDVSLQDLEHMLSERHGNASADGNRRSKRTSGHYAHHSAQPVCAPNPTTIKGHRQQQQHQPSMEDAESTQASEKTQCKKET